MIVTGSVLWLTRWQKVAAAAADAAAEQHPERTTDTWEEPARLAVLTMIILIVPMYGSLGDTVALALSAYMVFYFMAALRR